MNTTKMTLSKTPELRLGILSSRWLTIMDIRVTSEWLQLSTHVWWRIHLLLSVSRGRNLPWWPKTCITLWLMLKITVNLTTLPTFNNKIKITTPNVDWVAIIMRSIFPGHEDDDDNIHKYPSSIFHIGHNLFKFSFIKPPLSLPYGCLK